MAIQNAPLKFGPRIDCETVLYGTSPLFSLGGTGSHLFAALPQSTQKISLDVGPWLRKLTARDNLQVRIRGPKGTVLRKPTEIIRSSVQLLEDIRNESRDMNLPHMSSWYITELRRNARKKATFVLSFAIEWCGLVIRSSDAELPEALLTGRARSLRDEHPWAPLSALPLRRSSSRQHLHSRLTSPKLSPPLSSTTSTTQSTGSTVLGRPTPGRSPVSHNSVRRHLSPYPMPPVPSSTTLPHIQSAAGQHIEVGSGAVANYEAVLERCAEVVSGIWRSNSFQCKLGRGVAECSSSSMDFDKVMLEFMESVERHQQ